MNPNCHYPSCMMGGGCERESTCEHEEKHLADKQRDQAIKERDMLKQKLAQAVEFVLWATPCGQSDQNPTYETIGKLARETWAKIRDEK